MSKSMTKVLSAIQKLNLEIIDMKYTDLFGRWRHVTLPAHHFSSRTFYDGVPLEETVANEARGEKNCGLALIPDGETFLCDPFWDLPTGSILCNIVSSNSKNIHTHDTRSIAQKAEQYLIESDIADESRWSPQLEFQIFDKIAYQNSNNSAHFKMESQHQPAETKNGIPPRDVNYKIRSAMASAIQRNGIPVCHYSQKDSDGGSRIELNGQPLVAAADIIMQVKYTVRMIANKFGKSATFIPATAYDSTGNGMTLRHHLFKKKRPVFFEKSDDAKPTETALNYIGGLIAHTPAIMAFTNPSTNSYKRLLSFSNFNTAVHIQSHSPLPNEKQIELRFPDATCNPYLAIAATLMAGLDGVKRGIDPKSLNTKPLPKSLNSALESLEKDYEFLLEGGVFSKDLINLWIHLKREEYLNIEKRPHPYELELYSDI